MRLFGITFLSLEKRRVLLDIAVFGLIGVWLGFALRSHVEVSDLHHATRKADRQKVYSAPLIDDTKRNSSASSAEALQYLNGIEWQWTNISGLFGDGDGVNPAPTVTTDQLDDNMEKDDKLNVYKHSFQNYYLQVISRLPRIQLFRYFANSTVINTALADALYMTNDEKGAATVASGYKASNMFGLKTLKTHAVNATLFPSMISAPWKIYRLSGASPADSTILDSSNDDYGNYFESYPFTDEKYDEKTMVEIGEAKMTLIITLQSPEEGGEFIFPLEGIENEVGHSDFTQPIPDTVRQNYFKIYKEKCQCTSESNRSLKVKTVSGDAVLLFRTYPNNYIDIKALFGLCNVKRGKDLVVAAIDATLYKDY